ENTKILASYGVLAVPSFRQSGGIPPPPRRCLPPTVSGAPRAAPSAAFQRSPPLATGTAADLATRLGIIAASANRLPPGTGTPGWRGHRTESPVPRSRKIADEVGEHASRVREECSGR